MNNGVPRGIPSPATSASRMTRRAAAPRYAATGAVGLGMLGLHRHARRHSTPDGGTSTGVSAAPPTSASSAGRWCRFFVNLQAGVGYADLDGLKTTPRSRGRRRRAHHPLPDLRPEALVRAPGGTTPRIPAMASGDETAFGYSAGLDLAFVFGLGLRTAYDWVDGDPRHPSTWSVGAKWSFGL